jgi:succinoglycan biosynthesis transport protein ExoP
VELQRYLGMLRRWAWLLAVGLIAGAGIGYGVSAAQEPVYQATTKILATRPTTSSAGAGTATDLSYVSDWQLVQTYMQLLPTRPVLDEAAAQLGYGVSKDQLIVTQVESTNVFQLTVEDSDPQKAASVANALVQALVKQNDVLQAGQYTATEQSLQEQLDQTQQQIDALQSQVSQVSTQTVKDQLATLRSQIDPLQQEVTSLQKEIAASQPTTAVSNRTKIAADQARLNEIQPLLALYQQIYSNLIVVGQPSDVSGVSSIQLTHLQTSLDLYKQVYLNLLTSLESVRLARLQNTPNVVQIEVATVPTAPVRPKPLYSSLMGGPAGLVLAGLVAFGVEFLDNTIKTPEDVRALLNLSVLGYVGDVRRSKGDDKGVYVLNQPRSPVAEAFRSLRTNLEFSSVDRPLQKLLVTSSEPGDGKTTIAVNLAAILAQGGKRVVLVDADLRKPRVHAFVGVSNRKGLSDLFRDAVTPQAAMQRLDGTEVAVITSGSLPPNPSELLQSARMDQILAQLVMMSNMVILDSPPAVVSDIQILAAKADGVLLVIQPGRTNTTQARATLEQLSRAGARVLGVVFNRIPRSRPYYYGGYQHYSPYQSGAYGYYGEDDSGVEKGHGKEEQRPKRAEKDVKPEKVAKVG